MTQPPVCVCVIGLWHLGCVYSACLAKLGYKVAATDADQRVVENLRQSKVPVAEPGLDNLIREGIAEGNLSFVGDLENAVRTADFVVIAYDTPLDTEDRIDLSPVLDAVNRLRNAATHATIVVSSQVPIGTCERMVAMLSKGAEPLDLAYVPENLRLGRAIECFMNPDRIVIGSDSPSAIAKVRALFAPIHAKVIEMDLRSAEMSKHALNAFLGTAISFANEIGNICDLVGADGLKVAEALKSDSRIGSGLPLRPGLGFAGGTLARDLRILQNTGKERGCETTLVDSVLLVNENQNASIIGRLQQVIGKLEGKYIGVLGLTYKAGTGTLRRSAALKIIRGLQQEGVLVKAFDPRVSAADVASETLLLCDDAYAACDNVDALVILNDCEDFAKLDFKKVRKLMKEPVLFDAQNLLDRNKIVDDGFRYVGIGRGMRQQYQGWM